MAFITSANGKSLAGGIGTMPKSQHCFERKGIAIMSTAVMELCDELHGLRVAIESGYVEKENGQKDIALILSKLSALGIKTA